MRRNELTKEFLEKEGWVWKNTHDRKFHGECTNEKYPDWHIVGMLGHPDGEFFINYKLDIFEIVTNEKEYFELLIKYK